MPRRRLVRGLALPLLAAACLAQIIVTLARIAISYRAAELALSPSQILIISSAFSVLPAGLAVSMGRYNDGHGNGVAAVMGPVLMVIACGMLIAPVASAWWLLAASIVLGLGQTLQLTGLQGEVALFRRPRHRTRMVGGLMVWQAVGQVMAPGFLSILALSQGLISVQLAIAATLVAVLSTALGLSHWHHAARPNGREKLSSRSVRQLVAAPELLWVMVAGSLCVAVHDLMLIYLPVIGLARGMPATQVGLLLALSAAAQMVARMLYAGAVAKVGPRRLMFAGIIGTALPTMSLFLPLGVVSVALLLTVSGIGMGLAISSSLLLTMSMAPPHARATSLGLRLAVNRVGQFVIPVGASGAAAAFGPDAVFLAIGLLLASAGLYGVCWLGGGEQ